jgi:hypothetical protein
VKRLIVGAVKALLRVTLHSLLLFTVSKSGYCLVFSGYRRIAFGYDKRLVYLSCKDNKNNSFFQIFNPFFHDNRVSALVPCLFGAYYSPFSAVLPQP